jgi:uronate dehydrogenase
LDIIMQRILITGAAGAIGSVLRTALRGSYPLLRLTDIAPLGEQCEGEELVQANLEDLGACETLMQGVDCVVHLGGVAFEDTWEKILPANIVGCYNVFEAARRQQVKRVVFASSNHAVGFHRRERVIDAGVVPRPDTRYGVSKVFGEAVGRLYADKYGLSVASLRIGSFVNPDRPGNARQLLTWISHRDMVQLVRRCVDHPDYHYVVVYGVSNNTRSRWDNSAAKFLGYLPDDDAEIYAQEILAKGEQENEISAQFHGGFFTPMEFAGDTDRID